MAAMAASCSVVAFWTASCCAILSSMVSAKAAAVGAPSVVGDSSSDGESDRAMIFADATLSAPRMRMRKQAFHEEFQRKKGIVCNKDTTPHNLWKHLC
ncbi:hypothetical protein DY000_02020287 [Brassica cretica]|uniref:Secreted protein n=1 Tax=Brassica cretica TaxID=69181 RepID=A0ABQ7E6Q4_BRACR|nr:hypothetical protein DY000_02020287 [Brassica cretica]